jgi:pimeloyl-ACP methyl ester carboxylesterase
VEAVYNKTSAKVRLVGWSRGGVLAREIARDHHDLVDRVIMLARPVKGGADATAINR